MTDMAYRGCYLSNADISNGCHMCTFRVAAIFFRSHPYIWYTTIHHDTQTEIIGRPENRGYICTIALTYVFILY